MKVTFLNGDYTIFLNKDENELEKLRVYPLEARLIDAAANRYFDKNIKLEFVEDERKHRRNEKWISTNDGLLFKYVPEGCGWKDSTCVLIKITQRVIDSIKRKGYFSTRYGLMDKIWIYEVSAADYNERYSNI